MQLSDVSQTSGWIKSTKSNPSGNCVRTATAMLRSACVTFRKSSYSHTDWTGNCASVGQASSLVLVQDTKEEHLGEARTTLVFPAREWERFCARLQS